MSDVFPETGLPIRLRKVSTKVRYHLRSKSSKRALCIYHDVPFGSGKGHYTVNFRGVGKKATGTLAEIEVLVGLHKALLRELWDDLELIEETVQVQFSRADEQFSGLAKFMT